jgi:hypothetical protein
MSWHKEKREHPWASTATAKRIASDHAKKSKHPKTSHTSIGPLQTANKDFTLLDNGAKRIAHQRKP